MARGDLILSIVRAARQGDDDGLRRSVEALVAEERGKQHHVLADRLEGALRQNGFAPPEISAEPVKGVAPVDVVTPRIRLDDLVLSDFVRSSCDEVVQEHQRLELLRSYGLEPRHRILLTGPPGNGKTSLAEALADALLVPLLRVRYEAVVGSFLGETATQLSRVFSFARTRHAVLFLDEFDALAKERGDVHETGEIKRVVSSLLMQIDDLPSHVVVVAASNHPELLDRAADRRFEVHLHLPAPDLTARVEWFSRFVDAQDEPVGRTSAGLARITGGASFASLQDLVMDIQRRHILEPDISVKQLVSQRLARWKVDRRGAGGS